MTPKKNYHYMYAISSDIIEIKVKNLNRVIYKNSCPIADKKKITKILKELDNKGFINLKDLIKKDIEKKWF